MVLVCVAFVSCAPLSVCVCLSVRRAWCSSVMYPKFPLLLSSEEEKGHRHHWMMLNPSVFLFYEERAGINPLKTLLNKRYNCPVIYLRCVVMSVASLSIKIMCFCLSALLLAALYLCIYFARAFFYLPYCLTSPSRSGPSVTDCSVAVFSFSLLTTRSL